MNSRRWYRAGSGGSHRLNFPSSVSWWVGRMRMVRVRWAWRGMFVVRVGLGKGGGGREK